MTKLMWVKQVKLPQLSWNPTRPLALLVKRSSLQAREILSNGLGLPKLLEITITWVISRTTWSILLYWAQSTKCVKVDLNRPDFLLSPRGFIQLHNRRLLWWVLEQFILFDISMLIFGMDICIYMDIYISIYPYIYGYIPLFICVSIVSLSLNIHTHTGT